MNPDGNEPFVAIGQGRSKRSLRDTELVLRSASIPFVVEPRGSAWVLGVRPEDVERARRELADYSREESQRPTHEPIELRPATWWWQSVVLYVAILIVAHLFATHSAFDENWYTAGRAHAESIRSGGWWRTITALFLHTGVPHLSSNLLYGSIFAGLVAYTRGGGVAFLGVLAAGAMGNAINAFAQDPGHLSVGASTAVFGAVGLLCGTEWRRRAYLKVDRMRRFGPLFLGVVLFSWLGVGENPEVDRIDVFAHVFGVVAGIALGAFSASLPEAWARSIKVQSLATLAIVALVGGAWLIAFAA